MHQDALAVALFANPFMESSVLVAGPLTQNRQCIVSNLAKNLNFGPGEGAKLRGQMKIKVARSVVNGPENV